MMEMIELQDWDEEQIQEELPFPKDFAFPKSK